MTVAEQHPTFRADGAPVSVLVDYDGTISTLDVGDELLARFFDDRELTASKDADYELGRAGSRELVRWDLDVLPRDPAVLMAAAAEIPQDETLLDLVAVVRRWGAAIEVVSDGFGFHVAPKLAEMGLADVAIATNENRLGRGGAGLSFPFGHPRCFVCGTCKRERVRRHQAAGRLVVLVGDGMSDRYAAQHANLIFAKSRLATVCGSEGWTFQVWDRLGDVADWLASAFTRGDLPSSSDALGEWLAVHPRRAGFICGPEAWGPDRASPVGGVAG